MIPKIIHYVWVGKNQKPKDVLNNINSWKIKLDKNWKIIEWNEDNFDIEQFPCVKYWYDRKNWAFVSDFIRTYVLYTYGGVYLDTDVEMLKSLEDITQYDFIGSRTYIGWITASTFGSKANNELLNTYMKIFKQKSIYTKMPKIMSTHILTYAFEKNVGPLTLEDKNLKINNSVVMQEKYLQLGNSDESYLLHKHYDNWKNQKKTLKSTKYLHNKIKFYENGLSEKSLNSKLSKKKKIYSKIDKAIL